MRYSNTPIRWSQYSSEQFQTLLADRGISCSMSRSGNMAMQNFFSSLLIERTARKVYRTKDQARADVFDYIERFYNPRRRHSIIGYLSPMEFERISASAHGACPPDRQQLIQHDGRQMALGVDLFGLDDTGAVTWRRMYRMWSGSALLRELGDRLVPADPPPSWELRLAVDEVREMSARSDPADLDERFPADPRLTELLQTPGTAAVLLRVEEWGSG